MAPFFKRSEGSKPTPSTKVFEDDRSSLEAVTLKSTYKARLASLNQAEKYWAWKAGVRLFICLVNLIAICALAWLISKTASNGTYTYGYGYGYVGLGTGAIVTCIVSFIWCIVAILLPLRFKRSRPLHPGIAVGLDLAFWGGFLVLGMFTLTTIFEVKNFGSYNYVRDPSYNWGRGYSGSYYRAPNNTWVYNITYVNGQNSRYNATTGQWVMPQINTTGIVRSCTPQFSSCEQQDQWVNEFFLAKPQRLGTTILVNAACWLNLALHFVVFVWACVDTHKFNNHINKKKEKAIADRIIADLQKKGIISVENGVVQAARSN